MDPGDRPQSSLTGSSQTVSPKAEGQVRHRLMQGCAVPVLLVGRRLDQVTRADLGNMRRPACSRGRGPRSRRAPDHGRAGASSCERRPRSDRQGGAVERVDAGPRSRRLDGAREGVGVPSARRRSPRSARSSSVHLLHGVIWATDPRCAAGRDRRSPRRAARGARARPRSSRTGGCRTRSGRPG